MKLVITSKKWFEKFYTKYKNMDLIRTDASNSRSSTWLYNRKVMYLKKKRINPQKEYTWRISSLQKTQRVKTPKKLLDAIANYKENLDSPNHVWHSWVEDLRYLRNFDFGIVLWWLQWLSKEVRICFITFHHGLEKENMW